MSMPEEDLEGWIFFIFIVKILNFFLNGGPVKYPGILDNWRIKGFVECDL